MSKLQLSRETLRHLDPDDSAKVVGGKIGQSYHFCAPSLFNVCTAPPMTQERNCTIVFSAAHC